MALEGTCTNAQQLPVTMQPLNQAVDPPEPAPLDGELRIQVLSGDGSFSYDPAEQLVWRMVSGNSAGDSEYLVEGDARIGAGVSLISERFILHVTSTEATGFGATIGEPEDKPVPEPPAPGQELPEGGGGSRSFKGGVGKPEPKRGRG